MLKDSKKFPRILKKTAFFILLLLAWQMIFYFGTEVFFVWKQYMFPNPLGVLSCFHRLSANSALWIAAFVSLRRVFIGFLISIVIGTILGVLIYKSAFLNQALKPIFLGLQTLPSICWLPFAVLWFGLSDVAILFVIVVGSTFSVAIAVEAGFSNVNPLFIKAGRTMGASPLSMLLYIIIPDSLPHIVVGLKQGWSFSWRALMNGEVLSATRGLGHILILGRDLADINQVMCVIIIIFVLGIAIDYLFFGVVEKRMRLSRGLGSIGKL